MPTPTPPPGSRGPGLGRQPGTPSPGIIDPPPELRWGSRGRPKKALRLIPIFYSSDPGPGTLKEGVFYQHLNFLLHSAPAPSLPLHPRNLPAGSRRQLILVLLKGSPILAPFCSSPQLSVSGAMSYQEAAAPKAGTSPNLPHQGLPSV